MNQSIEEQQESQFLTMLSILASTFDCKIEIDPKHNVIYFTGKEANELALAQKIDEIITRRRQECIITKNYR